MDKRSVKKVVLPLCSLALLFAESGCCNFYQLEGNGARSKAEFAEYLPRAPEQQLDGIRVDAASSDVTILFDRGDYGGYKVKLHREFKWRFPVGPYHERSFWLPDSKRAGRSLCMELDCWGTELLPYMVGLFTGGSSKVYDFPRGDCIAYQRFMRAGIIPLLAYESSVLPVITDGTLTPGGPNVMSPQSLCEISTSLEGIKLDQMGDCYFWPAAPLSRQKYNRLTSYYFLCGLLAFGQKNERAYMQIAWCPIKLWSLEEEPPLKRVMSRFN